MKCPSCRFGTHVPTLKYQRSLGRRQPMGVGLVRVAEHDVADADGVGDGARDLPQVSVIVDRRGPLDPAGGEPGHQQPRGRGRGQPAAPRAGRRQPEGGRPPPARPRRCRPRSSGWWRTGCRGRGPRADPRWSVSVAAGQPVLVAPARARTTASRATTSRSASGPGPVHLAQRPHDHLDVVVRKAERQQRVLASSRPR